MNKLKDLIRNKRNITAVVLIVLLIIVVVNWQRIDDYFIPAEPDQTGIITSSPEPKDLEIGAAITELKSQLPMTTTDFAIESYDYKRGRFIVKSLEGNTNLQASFDSWYLSSGYTSIPKTMFSLND
jgi:hypothetical protein